MAYFTHIITKTGVTYRRRGPSRIIIIINAKPAIEISRVPEKKSDNAKL